MLQIEDWQAKSRLLLFTIPGGTTNASTGPTLRKMVIPALEGSPMRDRSTVPERLDAGEAHPERALASTTLARLEIVCRG
ncbi:hypothetical protein [Shimia abyssi]|uniref:Uncharacterized protein n=1 Tax=Shimia abyssi TaxID=1662395 RepID=A0A2P8EWM2_9RHOB|nr:hypothetical protein [Shimia abyssi]PSL13815.1 hypothetical protein CLV88_13110 [Shimia abyssi]